MADAPWRCSQCGTVNEPVANACRTCGRWPSLFELEGSAIEAETAENRAPVETYEPEAFEPELAEAEYLEPEIYEVEEPVDADEFDVGEEREQPKTHWQRVAAVTGPTGAG